MADSRRGLSTNRAPQVLAGHPVPPLGLRAPGVVRAPHGRLPVRAAGAAGRVRRLPAHRCQPGANGHGPSVRPDDQRRGPAAPELPVAPAPRARTAGAPPASRCPSRPDIDLQRRRLRHRRRPGGARGPARGGLLAAARHVPGARAPHKDRVRQLGGAGRSARCRHQGEPQGLVRGRVSDSARATRSSST